MPRIGVLAAVVGMAAPAAASAEPAWVDPFRVGFSGDQVAIAPDGTTVYAGLTSTSPARVAVKVRPPGGPLGELQPLSAEGATTNGLPGIAAGPDGSFLAAWVEGDTLQTARLAPGAQAFGAPTPIVTAGDAASGGQPSVAIDGTGTGVVLFATSEGSPGAWTTRMRAGFVPTGSAPPTSQVIDSAGPLANPVVMIPTGVAASADGAAIGSWARSSVTSTTQTTTAVTAVRRAGEPFGPPEVLDTGTFDGSSPGTSSFVDSPSVAITAAGVAAVTWSQRTGGPSAANTVKARVGSAAGLAPFETVATGGADGPAFPSVAIAPDGRVAVVFVAAVSGTQRPRAAFRAPGGSFDSVQTVQTTGDAASPNMQLAADGTGRFIAGWSTAGGGGQGVFAAVSAPGGIFGPAATMATGLSSMAAHDLAVSPAGDAVRTWRHVVDAAYVVDARGYDASGPQLRNLQLPSPVVGQDASFAVQPVDIWSPVASTTWSFGDGVTAEGAAVGHTYAEPGDRQVQVAATDALGNSSATSGAVAVAPAPAPPSPPGAAPDTTAPLVTAFAARPATFAVGPRPTALVAQRRVPRGTKFRFGVSEQAAVTLTIARRVPGLRSRGRCRPATARLRRTLLRRLGARGLRRARCTAYKRRGALRRRAVAGPNTVAFSGRLGRRALPVGRYRARLVATDAAGNRSKAATTRFRIVGRR